MFESGELIGLEVKSHHSTRLYVTILDFGLTSGISMVHPPDGPSEELAPVTGGAGEDDLREGGHGFARACMLTGDTYGKP